MKPPIPSLSANLVKMQCNISCEILIAAKLREIINCNSQEPQSDNQIFYSLSSSINNYRIALAFIERLQNVYCHFVGILSPLFLEAQTGLGLCMCHDDGHPLALVKLCSLKKFSNFQVPHLKIDIPSFQTSKYYFSMELFSD